MKTKKYFALQLKKSARLYPSILAITVLLIVSIAVTAGVIISNNANSDDKQKFKIGITGDLSNTYLDAGIAAVQNMDESRFSIEFVTLDEDEAIEFVKNGKISGYIRVPDNFVQSIMKMKNVPLVYVTSNTPTRFGSIMLYEIASTIADTVTETQKGIYAMQNLSKEYGKKQNYGANIDKINIEYITSVLGRSETVKIETVGIADGLSLGAYFVCGGIMIFLLLWGISCNSLLLKKDRSLEMLLISKGQSAFQQVITEYFAFFFVSVITILLFTLTGSIVFSSVGTGIPEIDGSYFYHYVLYFIGLIPIILMVTSLQFLFYELISGTVGVILLQFVFAIGSGYICGCLYPSYYFPVPIQKAASLLPTGVGLSYIRGLMGGSSVRSSLLAVMAYTLVFLALSCAVRKHRNTGRPL